jgi:diguanylate cyclase (GGDEF)-like protein/PAS domain S-box-containing protein
MTDAYFTLDPDGNFTFLNRAAAELLDPSGAGLVGRNLFEVFPNQAEDLRARYDQVMAGETVVFEKRYRALGGWFEVRGHPVPEGIAVYFRNIDEAWRARHERERLLAVTEAANARLRRAATTDELTGLHNRASLLAWLEERLPGGSTRRPAVLFIDLDRFKLVNDTHGHAEGDRLLCEVAARLEALVRAGDAVARLGGDEFVVALTVEREEEARGLAARILHQLRSPIVVDGRRIVVSASIGIAFAGPGSTAETILRDADAAMYQAKEAGRNCAETYDDHIRQDIVRRLEVETDLHGAAGRGEIRVAYQAVFDARTGDAVGAEALCRWRHPRRGLLGAGAFIPVAEESGLIVEIGDAMLERTVADLPALRTALGVGSGRCWVNVSSRQLEEPGFAEGLVARLEAAGVVGLVGIEVTETGLVRDHANTSSVLAGLAEEGVPIAIDDFGTGYSSLARLVDFPVDMLKIDQSFIQGLRTRNTADVIAAMVEVAHAVGAQTCAEGIETPEQLADTISLGVDLLSGYHLGRPVPIEALRTSLAEPRRLVSAAIERHHAHQHELDRSLATGATP